MHAAEKKLIALTKRPHLSAQERQRAADPFRHLRTFLSALGNPEQKIPHYIHVTGTSGKGSTAAFIASILHTTKAKTGLTVSPHIASIYDRWQINGTPITPAKFNRIAKKLTTAFKRCTKNNSEFGLSFFEVCTAFALTYFAEQKVTWVVLEVFNGGRVDPTNVIPHKDAAVITTVGLDHERLLGPTLAKIAQEKAGIFAPNTPAFSTVKELSTKKILRTVATKLHSPITFVSAHIVYPLKVVGAHQQQNAALAAAVTRSLGVTENKILRGLQKTTLPLRLEIVSKKPWLIFDGAHNPQKIIATVAAVRDLSIPNLHLVLSFSPQKNIRAMAKELLRLKPTAIYATTGPKGTTFVSPQSIAAAFPGIPVWCFNNSKQALRLAIAAGNTLVTGSIYLASDLKKAYEKTCG